MISKTSSDEKNDLKERTAHFVVILKKVVICYGKENIGQYSITYIHILLDENILCSYLQNIIVTHMIFLQQNILNSPWLKNISKNSSEKNDTFPSHENLWQSEVQNISTHTIFLGNSKEELSPRCLQSKDLNEWNKKRIPQLEGFLYTCLAHILEKCSLISWITDILEIADKTRKYLVFIHLFKEECIPFEFHRIEV